MSSNYHRIEMALLALHRLFLQGRDNSPEANAIRDSIDGPWEALSEVNRNRLRDYSQSLHATEKLVDYYESKHECNPDCRRAPECGPGLR